jgi:hypothetical protein
MARLNEAAASQVGAANAATDAGAAGDQHDSSSYRPLLNQHGSASGAKPTGEGYGIMHGDPVMAEIDLTGEDL